MNTYNIEIEETLVKLIKVNANNEVDAIKIVTEKYKNEEIILNSDDFVSVDMKVLKENISI